MHMISLHNYQQSLDTHSRSDKDKGKGADQAVANVVRVLVFGHGQKPQRLRYEERLGNCQGNYGQTRNHNTGNFALEDPNGIEKERGSSSAVSHLELGACQLRKWIKDDVYTWKNIPLSHRFEKITASFSDESFS